MSLKVEEIEDLFENKQKEKAVGVEQNKILNVVKKKTYFDPAS